MEGIDLHIKKMLDNYEETGKTGMIFIGLKGVHRTVLDAEVGELSKKLKKGSEKDVKASYDHLLDKLDAKEEKKKNKSGKDIKKLYK